MPNRKFKDLPLYTGNTSGSYLILNNSSQTTTHKVTKEVFLDGNNTFHGNQIISGALFISGTTEFGGNLVPRTARGATLGTLERPFREIYIQSASLNIASDIPGGRNAAISNADGNVTIQAAGFQLKSGSFVAFEISEDARTKIRVPFIPAGDIGAFSIIGNISGSHQPVTSAGGMVHITGNDGQSTRFNMDAFGSGSTTSFNGIIGRAARGTANAPSQSKVGDVVLRLTATGWRGDTGFGGVSIVGGSTTTLDFVNLEDQMDGARGSAQQFYNAPIGTRTRQLSAQIDATGINIPTSSDYKIGGVSYTASLATTGSNTFIGDQTITGSLNITGSGYINSKKILTELVTSSLATTGSNIFRGDQTITGSLYVSSSLKISNGFYVDGVKQFNYASFSDLTIQSASLNTAYPMKLNTTDIAEGFSIVSGSRITAVNTGTYNLQFSTQLLQTTNNAPDISIWLRKDGINVPNTNTIITIEKVTGGGKLVAAWNFIIQLNATQYVELMWSSTRSDTQLHFLGEQSTPTRPATPSVIVTMTQIA